MNRISAYLFIGLLISIFLIGCQSDQPVATSPPPTDAPIMGKQTTIPPENTATPVPQVQVTTAITTTEIAPQPIGTVVYPPNQEPLNPTEQGPISLDGSWLWASSTDPIAGKKNINNPRNYHLFIHENTLSLITPCNFATGALAYDESNIAIAIDDATLSNCPIEEQQFVDKLNSAETFTVSNGRLQLNLKRSDITLELEAIDDTPPQTWDTLLANLQDPFHKNYCDAPGGILLVEGQNPENAYFNAFGLNSLEENTPINTSTPMEIGDLTQSFTTVIILQLQEEGLLSLDDPISNWLPNITNQIPNGDKITVRHLAQNRSGIPNYTDSLIQPAIDNIDRNTIQEDYSPIELVTIGLQNLAEEPPFAPGEGWQYSNTNFILLGMIAEEITEQSLETLYQERIFAPLGMKNSFLLNDIPENGTVSQGYYAINNELTNFTDWNTSQGWAGSGAISTAGDMATYIHGLFNGRLFQSVFTLSEMLDFSSTDDSLYEKYGLGIGQFANTDYQAWGYEGQTPGFANSWLYLPENETIAILLTNSGSCAAISNLPTALPPQLFGLTPPEAKPEDDMDLNVEEAITSCALYDLAFPHPEPDYTTKRIQDFSPFADALENFNPVRTENILLDKNILEIQTLLDQGTITSEELVTYYLSRIQTYDIDKLNSVIALNPEAIAIAQALDAERAESGARGPMHGIPVLLKDNIVTGDGMTTSAGAYALNDWQASEDAFLVQQLRDAGAIILGKANLSEWANWMDECMPNGFSTLGGQTRNPYGAFEVSGSSSGPAAAVAANLATISVGTETQGSIIAPASHNSVVGLKTSMGLISRDNIIPLLPAQDVPGPIGRNVMDVAVLLSAMTGVDENDPVTQDAAELAGTDFTQFVDTEAAVGLQVGIVIIDEEAIQKTAVALNFTNEQIQTYRDAVAPLNESARQTGQLLTPYSIEIVEISSAKLPTIASPTEAITYGFKESLNQFLAELGDEAPIGSLAEIIALNDANLANHAPYGQSHLISSENTNMTADEFAAVIDENRETAVTALNAIFTGSSIDVLISSAGQAYAPAGFPAITVPNGYDATGEPQGIVFVGDYLGEPQLLTVAYAYEQATQSRVEPDLETTIQQIETILKPTPEVEAISE